MLQDGNSVFDEHFLAFVFGFRLERFEIRRGSCHVALLRLAAGDAELCDEAVSGVRLRFVGGATRKRLACLFEFLEAFERIGSAEVRYRGERGVFAAVLCEGLVHVKRFLVASGVEMLFGKAESERRGDF